jgi:hypothetical protein
MFGRSMPAERTAATHHVAIVMMRLTCSKHLPPKRRWPNFLMMNLRTPGLFAVFMAIPASMALAAEPAAAPTSAAPLARPEATEYWTPVPPVITSAPNQPPSDAIVLFDGTNLDAWEPVRSTGKPWKIEDGAMVVVAKAADQRTKQGFGDTQLHLEFRTPAVVEGTGQGRGNSGVFFMGLYELQVLDSYDNPTYVNGQAGSVYKQHPPLVNASRPPGEWQIYDAVFIAPRFDAEGKVISPARITAFHNGVLVQHDVVLQGPTTYRGTPSYKAHADKAPLVLQDHGNPVAYRNIWVRELVLPASK